MPCLPEPVFGPYAGTRAVTDFAFHQTRSARLADSDSRLRVGTGLPRRYPVPVT